MSWSVDMRFLAKAVKKTSVIVHIETMGILRISDLLYIVTTLTLLYEDARAAAVLQMIEDCSSTDGEGGWNKVSQASPASKECKRCRNSRLPISRRHTRGQHTISKAASHQVIQHRMVRQHQHATIVLHRREAAQHVQARKSHLAQRA